MFLKIIFNLDIISGVKDCTSDKVHNPPDIFVNKIRCLKISAIVIGESQNDYFL